jgi:hypothetical protein
VDDDRRCVLEDDPLLRHLFMRVEELVEISAVSFECLATLLRQCVESGFDDVVLIEVGSVGAGVSGCRGGGGGGWVPIGVTKICCHTIRIGTGNSCSKLQKPDTPTWQIGGSSFIGTNGSQGRRRASTRSSSSSQAMPGRWRGLNHNDSRSWGGG